jgi:hypothetical protein
VGADFSGSGTKANIRTEGIGQILGDKKGKIAVGGRGGGIGSDF